MLLVESLPRGREDKQFWRNKREELFPLNQFRHVRPFMQMRLLYVDVSIRTQTNYFQTFPV